MIYDVLTIFLWRHQSEIIKNLVKRIREILICLLRGYITTLLNFIFLKGFINSDT